MPLQRIKMIASAGWVLAVLAMAVAVGASGAGAVGIAAVGFLPPLALLLLWNEPAQTMSERIDQARR